MLVRRMNEMRRSARVEISRLKDTINTLQGADGGESGGGGGESKNVIIADLKLQLSQLKEDNSRKAKLLANFKSAKAAEGNSLEQWKFEAAQLDESCKR